MNFEEKCEHHIIINSHRLAYLLVRRLPLTVHVSVFKKLTGRAENATLMFEHFKLINDQLVISIFSF